MRALKTIGWIILGGALLTASLKVQAIADFIWRAVVGRASYGGGDQPPIIISDSLVRLVTTGPGQWAKSGQYGWVVDDKGTKDPGNAITVFVSGYEQPPTSDVGCTAPIEATSLTLTASDGPHTDTYTIDLSGVNSADGKSGRSKVTRAVANTGDSGTTSYQELDFSDPQATSDWKLTTVVIQPQAAPKTTTCVFKGGAPYILLLPHYK